MAASALRDELVFEAPSLLIQLHDRILPTRRQYGALSSHLKVEKSFLFTGTSVPF